LATRQAVLILTVVLIVVFSITERTTFATSMNVDGILLGQVVAAVLALGLVFPAAVGEFDVSIGYTLGFSSVVAAATGGEAHYPGWLALLLALCAGLIIGLVNGVLVAYLNINSLIATLGVGLAVSGLTVGASGSNTLALNIPGIFNNLARTAPLGISTSVWLFLGLAIVAYYFLAFTPVGRKMYAIGGSERVARLVGIRTRPIKVATFMVAGLLAALAGVLELGLSGAASPTFGVNLLLPAFAAVFLGSTTVRPGTFNVWGTVVAIALLAILFSGLSLAGVPFWTQTVFQGAALLIGVILSLSRFKVRSARAERK
jgi:ribose transport system permease protein